MDGTCVLCRRERKAFERALTRQADRHRRRLAVAVVAIAAAVAAFALAMASFDTTDDPHARTGRAQGTRRAQGTGRAQGTR